MPYGAYGYLFFATGNNSQEGGGLYLGTLYTGRRFGQSFSNVTTFVSEVKILGANGGAGGWTMTQGGFGSMDDPSFGIGTNVADIAYGLFARTFSDATVQETTNHLQVTFGASVSNLAKVRIGILTGSGTSRSLRP